MSFINPKIKYVLLFDALLFLLGIAGIYQLVERAGFNTTNDLEIKVTASKKLVFEKIIDPELVTVFMSGDILVRIDSQQVTSIDELEVVQVHHHAGKFKLVALGTADLVLQKLVHVAVVVEVGQTVGDG